MTTPVLAFFNNKGGVGKTSLVYHLATMFAEQGRRVLAVDLDPQANLTAAFLNEDQLAALWEPEAGVSTMYRSILPLQDVGDFAPVDFQMITQRLALIPGDLALSNFEDALSSAWVDALESDHKKTRPLRVLTAFWRSAQESATRFKADLIVLDVGPNLGALNRSALLGSNHVIVPLGSDLFSLQGLRNLGPTLIKWRAEWAYRRAGWQGFELPPGSMQPVGYIAMRHNVRLSRPVQAFTRWLNQIPLEYRRSVLAQNKDDLAELPTIESDPYCLAMIKNYNSLIALAQEARKPMFSLLSADGAIGSHANAARRVYEDFKALSEKIGEQIDCVGT
jgi:chromosome partitioning protein